MQEGMELSDTFLSDVEALLDVDQAIECGDENEIKSKVEDAVVETEKSLENDGYLSWNKNDLTGKAASLTADLTPIVGQFKSLIELCTNRDVVTGEEVGRLWALAGIIPLSKVVKAVKIVKEAKVASSATKSTLSISKQSALIKKNVSDILLERGPKAISTAQKGIASETTALATLLRAGFKDYVTKIGANNGFDIVARKGDVLVIVESKFSLDGILKLATNKGGIKQGSVDWIKDVLGRMEKAFASDSEKYKDVGKTLEMMKQHISEGKQVVMKASVLDKQGIQKWATLHMNAEEIKGLKAFVESLPKNVNAVKVETIGKSEMNATAKELQTLFSDSLKQSSISTPSAISVLDIYKQVNENYNKMDHQTNPNINNNMNKN